MSVNVYTAYKCNICVSHSKYAKDHSIIEQKVPYKNLIICKDCNLIRYCGQEHLEKDEVVHQDFCKAIRQIKNDYGVEHPFLVGNKNAPSSHVEVEYKRIQLKSLLRAELNRKLQRIEEELTSYPAMCGVCFELNNLTHICDECQGQAYCSEEHMKEHKQEHKKICPSLQLYYCDYKAHIDEFDWSTMSFGNKVNLHKMDLKTAFEAVLLTELPVKPPLSKLNFDLFNFAGSFSYIATICYSLSFLNVPTSGKIFRIYVLGARAEGVFNFQKVHTEFFFLQFPYITALELQLIGPDTLPPSDLEMAFEFKGKERRVTIKIFDGYFDEFIRERSSDPSMIVAFNCGFSAHYQLTPNSNVPDMVGDGCKTALRNPNGPCHKPCCKQPNLSLSPDVVSTWSTSLSEFTKFCGVPIVFTSYTCMEADFDYAALLEAIRSQESPRIYTMKRIFQTEKNKNPFRDLLPFRQWHLGRDDEPIYYRNGYVQAVRIMLGA